VVPRTILSFDPTPAASLRAGPSLDRRFTFRDFWDERIAANLCLSMADQLIRIFSDLHYGDRASQVRSLNELTPLLEGVGTLVLNGDTLDTRPGPFPQHTAQLRDEVETFARAAGPKVVLLTGNHDPDLTTFHAEELAEGRVFVTHGDVLFDDIVPWSTEAAHIRAQIAGAQAELPHDHKQSLESQLALFRRVAASLTQRHQAERNRLKYAISYLNDTVWPPVRVVRMFRAWIDAPELAASLARAHRPNAQFIIIGHLHRPGVWKTKDGRVMINTGSFCRPFGACMVDLEGERLTVRRVIRRNGAFHPGPVQAEFTLAKKFVSPQTTA
jgi:predicted phosphodiesterase